MLVPIDTTTMTLLTVSSLVDIGDMIIEDPAQVGNDLHGQEVLLVIGFEIEYDSLKASKKHRTIRALDINSKRIRHLWEIDLGGFYWLVSAAS